MIEFKIHWPLLVPFALAILAFLVSAYQFGKASGIREGGAIWETALNRSRGSKQSAAEG